MFLFVQIKVAVKSWPSFDDECPWPRSVPAMEEEDEKVSKNNLTGGGELF
jgi:hypothetical protein